MSIIKRTFYLLYYLRESDFSLLRSFLKYASGVSRKSRLQIAFDAILSVYRYNVSLKDYFCFRFFEKRHTERLKWAGTGFMYEYQLIMNPKSTRSLLENKINFLNHFKPFVSRSYCTADQIINDKDLAVKMLSASSGLLVLKGATGQIGAEVEVVNCSDFSPDTLLRYMKKRKLDLVEEYVIQHPELMRMSPSGLNTIRIFTQLSGNKVEILGARLRITINSRVDNMAAGNPAAPVEIESGLVYGPAVFSNITKPEIEVHPLTGERITGFIVPHWTRVIDMVSNAALHHHENRSVGWDIAVTADGPELIEGNHNWCKLLWQLPVKQGLKAELEKYL